MKVLERMAKLSTCEDFLEFFEIPYDKKLLNSKRLFILKKFSQTLEKAAELDDEDEKYNRLRWSLLTIYGEFAKGYNPSAADIWGESSCASCSDSTACA
jgi:nitrogenase-stabilizing/protective protein